MYAIMGTSCVSWMSAFLASANCPLNRLNFDYLPTNPGTKKNQMLIFPAPESPCEHDTRNKWLGELQQSSSNIRSLLMNSPYIVHLFGYSAPNKGAHDCPPTLPQEISARRQSSYGLGIMRTWSVPRGAIENFSTMKHVIM